MYNYNTTTRKREEENGILFVALFIALLVWFGTVATQRLIARDEGFYTLAASLVLKGHTPTIDFFYPQMPLFPYLYAAWGVIVNDTFLSYRFFSAIFAAASGTILAIILRRFSSQYLTVFGVVLYATSHFVYPWYITAQTYSASVFFVLLSFLLATKKSGTISLLLAGVALGVAGEIRLFFWGLVPVFAHIVFWKSPVEKWKRLIPFLCGGAVPLIFNSFFLISDFGSFWFNNVGYHLLRSELSFEPALAQKEVILSVLTGAKESVKFQGQQYPLLLGCGAIGFFVSFWQRTVFSVSLIALALIVLSFLPTPTYVQYFATTIPFLIVPTVYAFTRLPHVLLSTLLSLIFAVLYLWYIATDYERYTKTGEGVIGIGNATHAREWNLTRLAEVQIMLSKHVADDEVVTTLWPGYLVGTSYRSYAGLENHFGFLVADKLTEEDRYRYHIVSRSEVQSAMKEGRVKYFLAWKRHIGRGFREALSGYEKKEQAGNIALYVKKEMKE